MDFGLSEEQDMLQQSAREFLTQECPPTLVRALYTDLDGFSRELHRKMAEQGWTGLLIPEAHDGLGLSMLDMAVLLEEMGRAALPGPFLFSSVLFALGMMAGGSTAQKKMWLPRIAAGEAVGTLAFLEADDRLDAAGVTLKAKKTRDGYTLSGTKMFVPFVAVADVLLVAARTSGKGEAGGRQSWRCAEVSGDGGGVHQDADAIQSSYCVVSSAQTHGGGSGERD